MSEAVVVDTNVPIVANGGAAQASDRCVENCIGALERVVTGGRIVIDDDWRILREYTRHLSQKGQQGVGGYFLKWVLQNRANQRRCELVHITPVDGGGVNYAEFPQDPDLKAFDPSDRKFAAVAIAGLHGPMVLNATDTHWWQYRSPLRHHGIRVEFLCPELMQE